MREGADKSPQNPHVAGRPDELSRNVKGDTSMARLQSKFLDGDQTAFDDIERWNPNNERSGLDEWRGRFWLPDGDRVDPTRKHCLRRDDGRAGQVLMDQFMISEGAKDKRHILDNSVFLSV
jgi:hypothetical protein